ncbi:helix-turn-helix transcriptional regulator [Micromonospora sp. CA-111912]|uniref:helix-turn-helix transcriptional regulator n=1 Tax=Micromonospora sp. CA-111912 TaxID=3239955 RepID=UPI003D8CC35E
MALKRHRLCQRRKTLGFSQERLAETLGVDRSTVVRWENAETDPQPWHRTRIAAVLRVTPDQFDGMLGDVSIVRRRGQAMGDNAKAAPARTELLSPLRAFLTTSYLPPAIRLEPRTVDVRRSVGQLHRLYQQASYDNVARQVPDVLSQATVLAGNSSGPQRSTAIKLLAAAYLAASKLAVKAGDGEIALVTADRAATAAHLVEDKALAGVAAYQASCAYLRLPGHMHEAEQTALASIEQLSVRQRIDDPDLLSVRGALTLLSAVVAARLGRSDNADSRLADAERLAANLRADGNRMWTAFGPTNVVIHRVSVAVDAGQYDRAFEVSKPLDTSKLPAGLVSRRAQVHLDLAVASAANNEGPSLAVLHFLEAERIAPETISANIHARTLVANLLSKERRSATPGLRPLATRAGLTS